MSKSNRLRLSDVRAIFRIVGDCRDLGDDPHAWTALLVRETNQLLGCYMTNSFTAAYDPTTILADAQILADVWPDEASRLWWYAFVLHSGYRLLPSVMNFIKPFERLTVTSREEMFTTAEWHPSEERNNGSQDEYIYTAMPIAGTGRFFAMSLNRGIGDAAFKPREVNQVRMLHQEIGRLFGTRLRLTPNPIWHDLTPRLRDVLLALRTGDSEKQIALRLGLSRHTVHDYIGKLYQRFDVSSRAELLSICRLSSPHSSGA